MRRSIAVFLVPTYLLCINLFFRSIQTRLWNYFNFLDFLITVALIAPFIAARWLLPMKTTPARIAWVLCAVMAADVLFFGVGTFAPTGGHPSLEAILSIFLGLLKVLLVPLALISLTLAALRGERVTAVLLGLACLIGETLYTVPVPNHPIEWLLYARLSL